MDIITEWHHEASTTSLVRLVHCTFIYLIFVTIVIVFIVVLFSFVVALCVLHRIVYLYIFLSFLTLCVCVCTFMRLFFLLVALAFLKIVCIRVYEYIYTMFTSAYPTRSIKYVACFLWIGLLFFFIFILYTERVCERHIKLN